MRKVLIGILTCLSTLSMAYAYQEDPTIEKQYPTFTLLNSQYYEKTFNETRTKISNLIDLLEKKPNFNLNDKITFITNQLLNTPYSDTNTIGEGDWQPKSTVYKPGAIHIVQNPVYRLDYLDCQSFVTLAMALLHAHNLNEFDEHYLKIAYGAAGNPGGEIVHYYNRNNFVDADLNPVNQKNGLLLDITSKGPLSRYTNITVSYLNRQNWFSVQQQNLGEAVRVLSSKNAPAMVKRFLTVYSNLNIPRFKSDTVALSYIPKSKLVTRQYNGFYVENKKITDQIPTPAVAEIVSDARRWYSGGINISELVGTEFNVSHFGLLFRETFHYGDLIYNKINCRYVTRKTRVCTAIPVICGKDQCDELMFANATDAYPDGFYWYQKEDGRFICTSDRPPQGVRYTYCNRVEKLPLFNYLTDYQYGSFWHMNNAATLGLHIEKLL